MGKGRHKATTSSGQGASTRSRRSFKLSEGKRKASGELHEPSNGGGPNLDHSGYRAKSPNQILKDWPFEALKIASNFNEVVTQREGSPTSIKGKKVIAHPRVCSDMNVNTDIKERKRSVSNSKSREPLNTKNLADIPNEKF